MGDDLTSEPFPFALDQDEALVLFEFLARFERDDDLTIANPAEAVVLTKILGQLESHLVAPLDSRYAELLNAARSRVEQA